MTVNAVTKVGPLGHKDWQSSLGSAPPWCLGHGGW